MTKVGIKTGSEAVIVTGYSPIPYDKGWHKDRVRSGYSHRVFSDTI